jgi:sigma-B regulation protein RsbU (phosphoserine phosphatase)
LTAEPRADTPAELLEDAPCGYISTLPDGTIDTANRAFEAITGVPRDELIGRIRFQDLLPVADRIYHETHYRPLLLSHGVAREIAVNLNRRDGSRLPVLLNSVLVRDGAGEPRAIRTVVFPATDRRSYEEELLGAQRRDREIALQLQRSLLIGDVPQADGVRLAVGYEPGVSTLEAGGDWYDAFWVEPGKILALVVGDVVGRGLHAAMAMGQLRSAVRAFASTGLDPAGVLTALDRYSALHGLGEMTTIVYGQLTLADSSFEYACAGHPPALLAVPGQVPAYLKEGRSMPIASWDGLRRTNATIRLEPGSTVVLYTDGLVEAPSQPLSAGMAALREIVGARADESAQELCTSILDGLRHPDYHDDTCLVVAQLAPGP